MPSREEAVRLSKERVPYGHFTTEDEWVLK